MRLLPAVALILTAAPAFAGDACAAAPDPDCLIAAAREAAAGIADADRRDGFAAMVDTLSADPQAMHADLLALYVSLDGWLDGRLGDFAGAEQAARALPDPADRVTALIALGKFWQRRDLIAAAVAELDAQVPGTFSDAQVDALLFTALAEDLRLGDAPAAYAIAASRPDALQRATLFLMIASLMTPV